MKHLPSIITLFLLTFLIACDSGPKVIEAERSAPETSSNTNSAPVFKDVATPQSVSTEEHKVVVEEKLDTDKYSYLNVSENGEKYWIAVSKMPVEIGDVYYYKGGLMKKNFFSKEHNRVFETVYLVSDIRKQPAAVAGGGSAVDQALNRIQGNAVVDNGPINVKPVEGGVKLSELFANMEKYNGKVVKVSGKCVKINPMIMSRNWIHLQDGSGENLDLTVTTTENIPLGHVVTLEGTIALNKDFGAGYRYDIIMEGAVLK